MRTCSVTHSCPTLLQPHGLQPTRLLCLWDSPGKNPGAGCHFLLQGDLPDPGMEPTSSVSPALAGRFFTTAPTGKHYKVSWTISIHSDFIGSTAGCHGTQAGAEDRSTSVSQGTQRRMRSPGNNPEQTGHPARLLTN